MRLAWFLVIVGGVMALTPGVIDPVNVPVNGLTLLGIIAMVSGAMRAVYSS